MEKKTKKRIKKAVIIVGSLAVVSAAGVVAYKKVPAVKKVVNKSVKAILGCFKKKTETPQETLKAPKVKSFRAYKPYKNI